MATKVDKKMESAEKAASLGSSLKGMFEAAKKSIVKSKVSNVYTLEEYADEFPVMHCLSTGLPSLDLHMMKNHDGTQWGAACGRWTELGGIEQIGKTLVCHYLVADCLRRGGMAFWIQAEGEFDTERALELYGQLGVDVSDPAAINFLVQNATSVKDLYGATAAVLAAVQDFKATWQKANPKKSFRKESPPVLFVVDSLAAIIASFDREGIEEKGWDKPTRMAGKAGEFHRFFQAVLNRFAELGIAGVGTNHLRASMSEYGPDWIAAHDSSLKYYMSLRLHMDRHPKTNSKYYDDLTKVFTHSHKKKIAGYPVRVSVKKIRGAKVEDGIIEIPYYTGYGFDYLDSVIDGAIVAGILKENRKIIQIKPVRKEILEMPLYDKMLKLNPGVFDEMFQHSSMRAFLEANEEFAALLVALIYNAGPEPAPDRRGKGKGGDDEEEDE